MNDETDFEPIFELQDEWEPDEEPESPIETSSSITPAVESVETPPGDYIDPVALEEELQELLSFSQLASRITTNAKGESLLPALEIAFNRASQLGAERKAVIFTESRRTQAYLFDLLSSHGYDGQLVLMTGSNATRRREPRRGFRMNQHVNAISNRLSLRQPQRDSLETGLAAQYTI